MSRRSLVFRIYHSVLNVFTMTLLSISKFLAVKDLLFVRITRRFYDVEKPPNLINLP